MSVSSHLVLFTRATCDDPSTELSCTEPSNTGSTLRDVQPNVPIYLIVGGPESVSNGWFQLFVSFDPYQKVGENCTFTGNKCAPGLWCDRDNTRTCVVNVPPVLERATVLRGGTSETDLIVGVNATDEYQHISAVELQARDSGGEAVVAFGFEDEPEILRFDTWGFGFDEKRLSENRFSGLVHIPDFFARTPSVSELRVTMLDHAKGRSNSLTIGIETQPVMLENEECDPDWHSNRCAGNLVCVRSGNTGRCSQP